MKRWSGLIIVAVSALVAVTLSGLTIGNASAVDENTAGVFVPVTPFRAGDPTIGSGASSTFQITGQGGIPASGVTAVVVDIAATSTTATTSSFLTAWPAGEARPGIGSMFYTQANAPRSNTAIVKIGSGGKISVYNYTGSTRVYVDVQGYFIASSSSSSAGGFVPVDPTRVARSDTGFGMPPAKSA